MMKSTLLKFKSFQLLCIFLLLSIFSQAQDNRDKFIVFGKLDLKSLSLQPVEGGSPTNLNDLKSIVKYSDKPTLIIFWSYKWCGPCLRLIDTLLLNNLDKQYNFIAVNIEEGQKNASNLLEINKLITERAGWNKIPQFQANFNAYENFAGISSTPYLLFADKNGKVIDVYSSYSIGYQDIFNSLKTISTGEFSANGKFYYDKSLSNAVDGKTYILKTTFGNSIILTSYQKATNKVQNSSTYTIENNNLIRNGITKAFYEDGKLAYNGLYQNGLLLNSKNWFNDGTLARDVSMPIVGVGFYKSYNLDGSKNATEVYLNRKREGLSINYHPNYIYESMYKNDVIISLKVYKNGVLESETKYLNGKPVK